MRPIPMVAARVTHQEHAALAGCSVLAACRAAALAMLPLAYGAADGLTAAQRRERRAARLGRRAAAA